MYFAHISFCFVQEYLNIPRIISRCGISRSKYWCMLWTDLCCPQIHLEAQILNVTIFGDSAFKEVIKDKRRHKDEVLIQ